MQMFHIFHQDPTTTDQLIYILFEYVKLIKIQIYEHIKYQVINTFVKRKVIYFIKRFSFFLSNENIEVQCF